MSTRVDTTSLVPGSTVVGDPGLGVTGAVIRATTAVGDQGPGFLYNDWDSASDDNKEFRGLILTTPSAGVFEAFEDGSFKLTGAPLGTYSFTYRLFVDGVDLGVATVNLNVGSLVGVQNDAAQGYFLRAGVSVDALQGYALRATVVQDASQAYALRSSLTSDVAQGYIVLGGTTSDSAQGYLIKSATISDNIQGYLIDTGVVRVPVLSDSAQGYWIRATVESSISQAYSIVGTSIVGFHPNFDRVAKNLINRYGTTWNYTQVRASTYNIETAIVEPSIEVTPVKLVLLDLTLQSNGFSQKYGTEILEGDKEAYMLPTLKTSGLPITITPGSDYITANGIRYTVVTFKEINPTGLDPIVYFLYLRR